MPEEMQKRSLSSANEAMKYHVLEKDIAGHIKKEFDMRYGATWHCIVGRSYGSDQGFRNERLTDGFALATCLPAGRGFRTG
ncbi:hypothetical protein ACTXT7_009858 [Hymenolepis weldensis]